MLIYQRAFVEGSLDTDNSGHMIQTRGRQGWDGVLRSLQALLYLLKSPLPKTQSQVIHSDTHIPMIHKVAKRRQATEMPSDR